MKRIDAAEDQVRRFRRRLATLLALDRGLRRAAAGAFLWGFVTLAARAGLGAGGGWLTVGLALTITTALIFAALEARRALPSPERVRALLDRRQGRGGLLMAGVETDLGAWRRELRRRAVPRLTWRAMPAGSLAAGAAAFLVVSFLVPPRALEATATRPMDLGRDLQGMTRDLEVLAEEGLLEVDESARLESELQALAGEASGDDPARAWEALDHLREITAQAADEAAEAARGEGERLAVGGEMARALEDVDAAPELRAAALRELADLATRAAAERRLLDDATAAALDDAARQGDLGRLRAALEQGRADLAASLERLHQAGLIDLEKLLEARRSLAAGDAELADFLDQNGLEASEHLHRRLRPGRGGVDRGRGDAPMTWQEPISSDGVSFAEEVLDPASLAALERSGLLGLQALAPPVAPPPIVRDAADGAADAAVAAGSGAAHTHQVLPRHRGAVRRFFARSGDEDP